MRDPSKETHVDGRLLETPEPILVARKAYKKALDDQMLASVITRANAVDHTPHLGLQLGAVPKRAPVSIHLEPLDPMRALPVIDATKASNFHAELDAQVAAHTEAERVKKAESLELSKIHSETQEIRANGERRRGAGPADFSGRKKRHGDKANGKVGAAALLGHPQRAEVKQDYYGHKEQWAKPPADGIRTLLGMPSKAAELKPKNKS